MSDRPVFGLVPVFNFTLCVVHDGMDRLRWQGISGSPRERDSDDDDDDDDDDDMAQSHVIHI